MKKIISIITWLFILSWIWLIQDALATDSSSTLIEWTNITVNNDTSWNSTSWTANNWTNTTTTNNSVSIRAAWNALSSFTDWLSTNWDVFDVWDFNGDNIPDVLVYRGWSWKASATSADIYEYSVMGASYVKSLILDNSYVEKSNKKNS